jgi:hypothetical protein
MIFIEACASCCVSHLRRSGIFVFALPSPTGWANLCRTSGADAAMRCTLSLAGGPLVLPQPQKRRQDRRTPNYEIQSRSLYQAPANGRNQGRPL